ncbi:MAG: hypothetical protein AAF639_19725 [Chloroflexota bacterium]
MSKFWKQTQAFLNKLWFSTQPVASIPKATLIEQKSEVIAQIRHVQRQLTTAESSGHDAGKVQSLRAELAQLMAEERRLRLAIDRAGR